MLTRRRMMRLSAGSLLAAGTWPGWLTAAPAAEDFSFAVVNDTHYLNDRCGPWFEKVSTSITALGPKVRFVLMVGDLAQDGKPTELGPMRDVLKGLGVPAYAVPGNHDYRTQTDRKVYDELFPDRLNYTFEAGGWQFVGLDSTDGVKYEKVGVGPDALTWLDAEVPKLDAKRPTVLFTHFPLGPGVKYRLTNADAVLDRFKGVNLRAVFNGHYHAFTEKTPGGVAVTTNRCCAFSKGNHDGTKEKGYFVCSAKDGKLSRTFVEVK